MLDFLKRLRVRMGALVLILIAALPEILDALNVIDLKAILGPWIGESRASMVLVVLAFMRPMIHLKAKED